MSQAAQRAALALVALAAYATAPLATFQFDDWNIVVRNDAVHGIAAWLASMPGIRPLIKLSYAINWTLDARPGGFVAFGMACHVASVLLVHALARRWIAALVPGLAVSLPAFVTAAIFALHPAQTEAVTYIAGRSVALAALACLASLYAWMRWRESAADDRWLAASCIAFALAIAARETAWTLPLAIVLVEAARGERLRVTLSRLRWHGAVLAVAAVAVALSPTYRRLLATSLALRGPIENLAAQVDGIAYLVARPLATLRVNIDPDLTAPAIDAAWFARAACIAGVLAIAAMQWNRRRWLAFGVLWFFVQLVATNGVIARLDLANDRQLYLAIIGPALAVGVLLGSWRMRAAARAAAAALVLALGLAAFVRNLDYASEVALWEATARASPDKARVWNNLGVAHREAGDRSRARMAFERSIAIDAEDYKATLNLRDLGVD